MALEIQNADWWEERIERLQKAIKGSKDMKPVYNAAGLAANRIWDNIFQTWGSRFGGMWKQPGPISKILRARGKRRTFVSLYEAEHFIVAPLQDTRSGMKSFGMPRGDGIFKVTGKSVTTGSRKKYMTEHNVGGSTKFVFDEQKESRFKRNFESKVNGEWNSEYFMLLNWMKKVSGKSFKLPKRRIEPTASEITKNELDDIHNAMDAELTILEEKFGLI